MPWELFASLVQDHALRRLKLGGNSFDIADTHGQLPGDAIWSRMVELEELDVQGLGYTGGRGCGLRSSVVIVCTHGPW